MGINSNISFGFRWILFAQDGILLTKGEVKIIYDIFSMKKDKRIKWHGILTKNDMDFSALEVFFMASVM